MSLQKFMDSMMQKNGKIRGLVRELREHYTQSTLMSSLDAKSTMFMK